jgi:hypothetical protein
MTPSDFYSCLLSSKWDWGNSSISGKYSSTAESWMYSTLHLNSVNGIEADYPFDVVDTRIRTRGVGRTVVLRYESTEGKDFELLGFAMEFTTTTRG